MSNDKEFFMLSNDIIHTLSVLPNEKAGQLFKHIASFVNHQNPTTEDEVINITFEPIKQYLIEEYNKKNDISIKRSNAAKNGVLKRAKNKPPKKPKLPFDENEQLLTSANKCSEIIKIFNQTCPDLPKASVTPQRITAIERLLKIYSLEQIGQVFTITSQSDYLNGKVRKWRANINWLLNPNNFVKVLEGNYDNLSDAKPIGSQWQEAKNTVTKYFN